MPLRDRDRHDEGLILGRVGGLNTRRELRGRQVGQGVGRLDLGMTNDQIDPSVLQVGHVGESGVPGPTAHNPSPASDGGVGQPVHVDGR